MINRKIDVIVKLYIDNLVVIANEKIDNDYIEIFNSKSADLKNDAEAKDYLKSCIKKIENENDIKINNCYVFIDQSKYYKISQDILTQEQTFKRPQMLGKNESLMIENKVKNFYTNTKDSKNDLFSPISFRPFKFVIIDKNDKEINLNYFPKKILVKKITIYYSVTKILQKAFSKILEIFSEIEIKIKKILTPSDISNFIVDEFVESKIIIDIRKNYSAFYYYNNKAIINSINLSFSRNDLIEKIAKNLHINTSDASLILNKKFDLISASEQTIFINNEKIIKISKLQDTIKSFISTILKEAKQHIVLKDNNLKIYLTGEVNNLVNIEEYSTKIFNKKIKLFKEEKSFSALYKNSLLSYFINQYENWKEKAIFKSYNSKNDLVPTLGNQKVVKLQNNI